MPKPLALDEEAHGAPLTRLGLSTRAARVFAILLRGGGHLIADLGEATGLSRQDAGEGARELETRGLARAENVTTGGRPSKRYHLAADARGALHALCEARRVVLRAEIAALDALEDRLR